MLLGKRIQWCLAFLLVAGWAAAQEDASVFGNRQALGSLDNPVINEASGLVASQRNKGDFWTHNDSGDRARIFLIDATAHYKATYYLEGITAYDWEDIAMMERNGDDYLLVGDIGDNRAERPYVQLHVFKEPEFHAAPVKPDSLTVGEVHTFVMQYEDGPRDAESLFVDPVDGQLYVVSKRELEVGVYTTPLPDYPTDTLILKKVCTLPHTFMTSAAVSADGGELLIKNLLNVFYWKRRPGETIAGMLGRPAMVQPYRPELQGEAVAFAPDGSGYYTISEAVLGMESVLYFYPRF